MKYKFNVLKGALVLLLMFSSLLAQAKANGKIGILCGEINPAGDLAELVHWSRMKGYTVEIVQPFPSGNFKNKGRDGWVELKDYRLLWLDLRGEANVGHPVKPLPEQWIDDACRRMMLKYLDDGGVLVVSGAALRYPCDLGLETVMPVGGIPWHSDGEGSWRSAADNEILGATGDRLAILNGSHDFIWHRFVLKPANGTVLGFHETAEDNYEMIRWKAGKGCIYGLAVAPWLGQDNKALTGAAALVGALYKSAGLVADKQLAERYRSEEVLNRSLRSEKDLKLTPIEVAPLAAGKPKKSEPYASRTEDGFVIGNGEIERRVVIRGGLRTASIWNKLANEVLPVGSTEFRLTFGEKNEQINIGPADFKLTGKPQILKENGVIAVELTLMRMTPPALRILLRYSAGDTSELKKSFTITNIGSDDLFLREVWIDTLRFASDVEVIPYGFLTAFARTKAGSLWLCQELPYSIPVADADNRYIGVAYPPCVPLKVGTQYVSENAYLTAVKRIGKMHGPWGKSHQFSSYGPWGDPKLPLDMAEIESCIDFIDRHGVKRPFAAFSLYHAYHDYKTTGYTNFLPYTRGTGSTLEENLKWIDIAHTFGVRCYALYPESNSWQNIPAAQEMLEKHLVPYMAARGMTTNIWFSSYSPGWYGGRWFGDREWKNFRTHELQDIWLSEYLPLIRKYRGISSWADQGHANIDKEYDQSFGYPGSLPMSPHLYKEFKGWKYIVDTIRREQPDFFWGNAHLGNAQAPLFSNINTTSYWCEPGHAGCASSLQMDRYPCTSEIRSRADSYRREQYWVRMERFVPFRFHLGVVDFQVSTNRVAHPIGEPVAQMTRYIVLQNFALHPTIYISGARAMTDMGYFGEREQEICRRWIGFAEKNCEALYNRAFVPAGEPRYGNTEIYSYGDRGRGWVFLINPHYVSQQIKLAVDATTGFGAEESYAVREITPIERWRKVGDSITVCAGEKLTVDVPPYSVVVLQLVSPKQAWKEVKEIVAGVEMNANGKMLGVPSERLEWAVFDVSKPSMPQKIRSGSGIVVGTNPRIELHDWTVRKGKPEEAWNTGFSGGQPFRSSLVSDVGEVFRLSDFAGAALWDMKVDPILDRVAVEENELKPAGEKGGISSIPSSVVPLAQAGEGCWLQTECMLENLPSQPCIYLQIAMPERVQMKMWINGTEQTCEKTFNDWAVLNPTGLCVGRNKLVLWIDKKK